MVENIITIKTLTKKSSDFVIHKNIAKSLNLLRKKNAILCFGNKKQFVTLKISDAIPQKEVQLSQSLANKLYLPNYPQYEMNVKDNEIIIGPYIGLLLCEESKKITTSFLNKMMVYVKKYSQLNGAVVVFALNKVDKENFLIEGYCYNPQKNEFQKGTFPYPCAIYRTIGLSEQWKNHFLFAIGDKIFNSTYFSKWDMYKWFSKDKELSANLPYTSLYKSQKDFFDPLEQFNKIFIKPISGLRGRGIVKASLTDNGYLFEYRENEVNHKDTLQNIDEVKEYLSSHFSSGKYLIQQAIDLIDFKGHIVDFRCTMQKNQSNKWQCKAIIGRCGDKDSIVSNISSGGRAFVGTDILRKALYLTQEEISELHNEMEFFATKVCNALDEFGINCGTLGLDIGLDTKEKLWLIEINNRDPDPSIAMDIQDKQLYYSLKTGPLFYAKALAGFKLNNSSKFH